MLTVGQVAFAKAAGRRRAGAGRRTYGGYVKYVFVGLGALLFLFFVTRQPASGASTRRSPASRRGCARSRRPRTLAELERLRARRPPDARAPAAHARAARAAAGRGPRRRATPTASRSRCGRGWRRTTSRERRRRPDRRARGRHARGAGGRRVLPQRIVRAWPAAEGGGAADRARPRARRGGLQAPARRRDRVAVAGDGEVGRRSTPTRPRSCSRSWPPSCRRTTRSRPAASTTRARCSSARSASDRAAEIIGRLSTVIERAAVRVPAPHAARPDRHVPAQRVAADDRARRREPAHDAGRAGARRCLPEEQQADIALRIAHDGRDAARRRARRSRT